uniref:Uncharacterized protein n=1 Tax=Panagrolaimus superbus TaxID=310955 RepID=A0A914ZAI6_9BILA
MAIRCSDLDADEKHNLQEIVYDRLAFCSSILQDLFLLLDPVERGATLEPEKQNLVMQHVRETFGVHPSLVGIVKEFRQWIFESRYFSPGLSWQ